MKTEFLKSEANFGCYSGEAKLKAVPANFSIGFVLDADIPLRDKFWFVRNNCQLSASQLRKLAIEVAKIVLPIYEEKYPDNKAPREAIQAAQDYLNGMITEEELHQKRQAAAYAADAAYDAAYVYAADAADAAAYAAAYAAYAAYTYAAYVYADAAAYAAADKTKLLNFLKEFTTENYDTQLR